METFAFVKSIIASEQPKFLVFCFEIDLGLGDYLFFVNEFFLNDHFLEI